MEDSKDGAVPIASPAAWSPTAAPQTRPPAPVLTLDVPEPVAVAVAEVPPPPAYDRLGALREVSRRLRAQPDTDDTLQHVVDAACAGTGSTAAMLTLAPPDGRQLVSGSAMGAGPYISLPLRAGGPTVGELVLTRMSGEADYGPEDETFAELLCEAVANALAGLRAGTVVPREAQDFVDRVTEELRSPLAGTASALDAALGGEAPLPADARRYLEVARADVRRLLGSVEDLLAVAHLREPELRHMEAVPVTPWLERAVGALRDEAEVRGVALTLRPPPEAYVVQGRTAQLDLVARHLIANGLRFTEPGGRVDVTAGLAEGMVRVSVRDTGIGFDPADAPRMTECFARALSAEAARIPGLGVGLFLANEIVRFHGGRLWLETRRDEGTQAHVALPPRAG